MRRLRKFFIRDLRDEDIWREIIEDGRLDHIVQLRRLTPAAAAALIQRERRLEMLSLGLVELSAPVAAQLAAYRGEMLLLNCLHSLDPHTAGVLAGFRGVKLGFDGMKTIPVSVLQALAPFHGMLSFDGVEEITGEPAHLVQACTALGASRLSLAGLRRPIPAVLGALAHVRGELDLRGMRELSSQQAAVLRNFRGRHVRLSGLLSLSPALVPLLAEIPGIVDLSGVRGDDPAFLAALAALPEERFLFAAPVRRAMNAVLEERRRHLDREETTRRQTAAEEERRRREADDRRERLLQEFARFDTMTFTAPAPPVRSADPAFRPISADEVEVRLNRKMDTRKRQVDALMDKGYANLTPAEKEVLAALRREIEALKVEIRDALESLVEEREVGALVFDSSDDLVRYLNESAGAADRSDAFEKMESADWLDACFGGTAAGPESPAAEPPPVLTPLAEGDDFIISRLD